MKSILNKDLVKQQGINKDTQALLESLHESMEKHKATPLEDIEDIPEYVNLIQEIEFAMQRLWGFPQDRNHHTHWYRDPKCNCPVMDNDERFGQPKYVSSECPLHGHLFVT